MSHYCYYSTAAHDTAVGLQHSCASLFRHEGFYAQVREAAARTLELARKAQRPREANYARKVAELVLAERFGEAALIHV